MFEAFKRTVTELLDSKKSAYGFLAVIIASVLHVQFGVSIEDALLLVSPLGLNIVSQAHVDAAVAKSTGPSTAGNVGNMVVNDPAHEMIEVTSLKPTPPVPVALPDSESKTPVPK